MRLKLLPVMRHVSPLLPPKGVRDFFKTRCRSRKHSYMMVIYLCLFTAFLIRFFFVMSAVATIDGASATTDCSSLGCKWRRRHIDSFEVEEMFRVLMEYPNGEDLDLSDAPKSMDDFIADIRNNQYSSKTIALKLRNMVTLLEQKTRLAKIQEYLYRHVASSSIPKPVHCLSLTLADEYTTNFAARLSLPIPIREKDAKDTDVVYYGPISSTIKKVKLLSLSTCCLSVSLGPIITFMTSPDLNVIIKGAVASSVILMSATTTGALHWFVSPYIHKLKWKPGSDNCEVEMMSWMASLIPRTIKFADIKAAETNRPYVSFEAGNSYYFIDAEHCHNKALLQKLTPEKKKKISQSAFKNI